VLDLLERQRPEENRSDHRGFEWYHLWHRTNRDARTLPGPKLHAPSLLSPDGRSLLRASREGVLTPWDTVTGQAKPPLGRNATIRIENSWLTAELVAAYSGDSTILATANGPIIVLWGR
jgi:hypothetical protein